MIARVAVLAFSFCLGGCLGMEGNGRAATESRTHDGFVAVESGTSLDIRVVRGDAFGVDLRVDENLLSHVKTDVRGSTLYVDDDAGIDPSIPGPHVVVTMPAFERVDLDGSGEIVVDGFDASAPVALALSGSGVVRFVGRAPAVEATLSGSGRVELDGEAGRVAVDLSGSGTIDARDLASTEADVDLGGSGNVKVRVDGPVDIDISGAGNVDLYGAPDIQRKDTSGAGKIVVH